MHVGTIFGPPFQPQPETGNPVLRIVLQRAWLNLNFPAVAQPISPFIYVQQEPDAWEEHDVGEQLARLEKEYKRHDSRLWTQSERDDASQIDLWPPRDSNQRR